MTADLGVESMLSTNRQPQTKHLMFGGFNVAGRRKTSNLSCRNITRFNLGLKDYLEVSFTIKITTHIRKVIMNIRRNKTTFKIPKPVRRKRRIRISLAQSEIECSQ